MCLLAGPRPLTGGPLGVVAPSSKALVVSSLKHSSLQWRGLLIIWAAQEPQELWGLGRGLGQGAGSEPQPLPSCSLRGPSGGAAPKASGSPAPGCLAGLGVKLSSAGLILSVYQGPLSQPGLWAGGGGDRQGTVLGLTGRVGRSRDSLESQNGICRHECLSQEAFKWALVVTQLTPSGWGAGMPARVFERWAGWHGASAGEVPQCRTCNSPGTFW